MRKIILFSSFLVIIMVFSMLALDADILWGQEDVKDAKSIENKGKAGINLQILEIDKRTELQDYMINLTKMLGTDCKFCHNIRDFTSDSRKEKIITREMHVMVQDINDRYFKENKEKVTENNDKGTESKEKITCFTCHRGRKHPINSIADLKKIEIEEAKLNK